jgi:branched-chain amino acid transport system substrate-binding protein
VFVSDWIEADNSVIRPMVDEAAAKYAKEKNLPRHDCKA